MHVHRQMSDTIRLTSITSHTNLKKLYDKFNQNTHLHQGGEFNSKSCRPDLNFRE